MSFSNATPANIATLSSLLGIEPVAARAWLVCESQSIANPTNPLNVRFYGRAGQLRGPGSNGASGVGFASYASALAGLTDAVTMLKRLAADPAYAFAHYKAIVDAAAGADPIAQAEAIEMSSWAAGHYGGTATSDGCIRRNVRAAGPSPTPPPEDTMNVSRIKGEDWTPAGGQRRPVRATPDRPAGVIVGYYEVGQIVRTIAEATTTDGNNWRLTEQAEAPGWILRDDFDPLVQGGDPAVDAALGDYIARTPPAPPPVPDPTAIATAVDAALDTLAAPISALTAAVQAARK